MLDHDDTISFLHQSIENIEEFLYIGEMKACRRLIEDIEGLPCRSFSEIESKFDTLSFSA